jgi:hypothetical protein
LVSVSGVEFQGVSGSISRADFQTVWTRIWIQISGNSKPFLELNFRKFGFISRAEFSASFGSISGAEFKEVQILC